VRLYSQPISYKLYCFIHRKWLSVNWWNVQTSPSSVYRRFNISSLIFPSEPELVPCYVVLHHNAANTGPYILHITPLYVRHIARVKLSPVTRRVNLCNISLSDIHFDLSIFNFGSVRQHLLCKIQGWDSKAFHWLIARFTWKITC
jgi:hypothetical protein